MSNFVVLGGLNRAVNLDLIASLEAVQSDDGWDAIAFPTSGAGIVVGRFKNKADAISAIHTLSTWRSGSREERKKTWR